MKSLMENDDYKGAFVFDDDGDPEDDSHEEEEGKRSLQEELAELAEPEAKESKAKKHSLIRLGST